MIACGALCIYICMYLYRLVTPPPLASGMPGRPTDSITNRIHSRYCHSPAPHNTVMEAVPLANRVLFQTNLYKRFNTAPSTSNQRSNRQRKPPRSHINKIAHHSTLERPPAQPRRHPSTHLYPALLAMPSQYNRIKVEDLLSVASSRGKTIRKSSHARADIFDVHCNYQGCTRTFASHDALVAHQKRSHAAPTAYVCEHCHATFSTAPNRNKHVSTLKSFCRCYDAPFRIELM